MESVLTLPICFVHDFVEDMQLRRRERENRSQVAIASFAASHEKSWKPEQFLPWDLNNQKAISGNTLDILRQLVDEGALNPRAEAAARARLKK